MAPADGRSRSADQDLPQQRTILGLHASQIDGDRRHAVPQLRLVEQRQHVVHRRSGRTVVVGPWCGVDRDGLR